MPELPEVETVKEKLKKESNEELRNEIIELIEKEI